jgi:hypothetical protein
MVFNLTGLYCLINRLFGQFDLLLAGRAALRARSGLASLERRQVDLLREAQELVEEHPGPVQGFRVLADYDVLQI